MNPLREDFIKELFYNIRRMSYVMPDEIPNIDLYMDQVTTFMDEHLASSKRFDGDKILTKTMINNYTKNNLLPPPVKKKYSKEHMLVLIFIYYLKNFLSISDIQSIMNPLNEHFFNDQGELSLETIYQKVFEMDKESIKTLAQDLQKKHKISNELFSDVESEDELDYLSDFAFICLLSFDIYIKKMIIERMIDKSLNPKKEVKPKNTKAAPKTKSATSTTKAAPKTKSTASTTKAAPKTKSTASTTKAAPKTKSTASKATPKAPARTKAMESTKAAPKAKATPKTTAPIHSQSDSANQ